MHYIKGIKNFADVFSRYSVGQPDTDDLDLFNPLELSSLHLVNNETANLLLTTLETIKEALMDDQQYQTLLNTICKNSFIKSISCGYPIIKEFCIIKDQLSILHDLIMYGFEQNNQRKD